MSAEFERRAQAQWDTHAKELESIKLKLCEEIEQIKREHVGEASKLQTKLTESKRFMEQQKYQILGLEQEKQKLEKALEESKTSTLIVETVKAKALELNEKLKSEQKEFLCLLNDMQTDRR
jgi:hypothetical protein